MACDADAECGCPCDADSDVMGSDADDKTASHALAAAPSCAGSEAAPCEDIDVWSLLKDPNTDKRKRGTAVEHRERKKRKKNRHKFVDAARRRKRIKKVSIQIENQREARELAEFKANFYAAIDADEQKAKPPEDPPQEDMEAKLLLALAETKNKQRYDALADAARLREPRGPQQKSLHHFFKLVYRICYHQEDRGI